MLSCGLYQRIVIAGEHNLVFGENQFFTSTVVLGTLVKMPNKVQNMIQTDRRIQSKASFQRLSRLNGFVNEHGYNLWIRTRSLFLSRLRT